MEPPHQIWGYTEKFGSHEPLLPLLCHRSGTHGREDKRHVPEQPPHTPSTHTHMYIQAHQKHFLYIASSHPLPPSDIKGISIETLMRGTHFKSNTLQSLYKKNPWVIHSALKKQFITCRFPILYDLQLRF